MNRNTDEQGPELSRLPDCSHEATYMAREREAEAGRVAQLAAPILAAWGASGSPGKAVQSAIAILAESRRQVAAAPAEGGGRG